MKRLVLVLLLPLFALSCQDAGQPVSPDFPLSSSGAETKADIVDIVDARDEDGNSRFAFGPPLTDRIKIEGAFDETAVTQVRVCELADPQTCEKTVWTSVEPVPVETQGGDSWFRVDWKLTDSDAPILGGEGAPTYRVGVFIDDFQIGYVDVKFDEDKVNQNIPVRYMVNEGALAEGLAACVTDGEIIDCDAVLVDQPQTVSVFTEEGHLAARAIFNNALEDEDGNPIFFLLEHLDNLTADPDPSGFPYFARARIFDQNGTEITEENQIVVDEFILCQDNDVPHGSGDFLVIRKHDDIATTLLPSELNAVACATETVEATRTGPAPSWDQHLRNGLEKVAGIFLPQPLRALHGGLNTTGMLCCSEFDAVQWDYRVTGGGELSVGGSTTVLNLVTVFANDAGDVGGQVEYLINGALTFKGMADGFSIGSDGSGNTVVNICGDITEGPYDGAADDGRFGIAIKDVAEGSDRMRENGGDITCSDLYGDTETSFPATMVNGDYVVTERVPPVE